MVCHCMEPLRGAGIPCTHPPSALPPKGLARTSENASLISRELTPTGALPPHKNDTPLPSASSRLPPHLPPLLRRSVQTGPLRSQLDPAVRLRVNGTCRWSRNVMLSSSIKKLSDEPLAWLSRQDDGKAVSALSLVSVHV